MVTLSTFIVVFSILGNHSDIFKKSLGKHISFNGRFEIIKQRLPIFIENGNLLVGFGHADIAYQKFFKKYGAPNNYMNMHNGVLQYNSDEPYILRVMYNYGILGLMLYVLLLFYVGKNAYLAYMQRKKIMFLPILVSMFAYFILRGTIENLNFNFVITLFVIAIAFTQKTENNEVLN